MAAPLDHLGAPDPGSLLFTYGTLMLTTGIAAVDEAMENAGVSLGRGSISGRLFDLGGYPGAVRAASRAISAGVRVGPDFDEDAPKVWGHLLRLKDPAALFAAIDPYEGFDPEDTEGSEFIRAETWVTLAGSGMGFLSQVYFYNFPTAGKAVIATGDYLAHRQAKGRPGQGRVTG
ncbi:MAG: gamma-glutamylcyclotransferase [Fibrobacteres bacterium]|nr:gamma-glutamylcyclotransferase [Fibrobacterota bacterium]